MRRALVTGGESGLGAACVSRLRADGIHVMTMDLASTANLVVDVTDFAAVNEAVASLEPFDILVNSAGILGPQKPFLETEPTEWLKTFEINVHGLVNVTKAVVPAMVEAGWGRVINVASLSGKEGTPNLACYSASKGAAIALTKSLGKELASTGVIVNAITPSIFETPMHAALPPHVYEHIMTLIPLGRIGRPEEVAAMVSWLASDEVSYTTGGVFDISGGMSPY